MPKAKQQTQTGVLEFSVEPTTLDEFAEEYKRLEREMSSLKKRQKDMLTAIKERAARDQTTTLDNGIYIKRTTYASIHFDVKRFQVEHDKLYNQYCEDLEKERITIDYVK